MSLRRFGVWTNLTISAALMLLVWTLLVWVASRPALRGLIDLTPQRAHPCPACGGGGGWLGAGGV